MTGVTRPVRCSGAAHGFHLDAVDPHLPLTIDLNIGHGGTGLAIFGGLLALIRGVSLGHRQRHLLAR